MALEFTSKKTDIIAPDDVVLRMDGSVGAAMQGMNTPIHINHLNFRLLSARPSDLNDPVRITDKVKASIASIENGEFDAMFTSAATASTTPITPSELRDKALQTLRAMEADPRSIESLITAGKQSIRAAHDAGIHPTDDAQVQAFQDIMNRNGELYPSAMDRLLSAERIPFVISNSTNASTLNRLGCLAKSSDPNQARLIFMPVPLANISQKHGKSDLLTFSKMALDSLDVPPLKILSNSEIQSIPGTDFTKVRYYLDKKRSEFKKYNKDDRTIYMFPTENEMVAARANGKITTSVSPKLYHDPLATFSETNYLLEAHRDEPERSKIRDRFDTNIHFRDKVIELLGHKVDGHLQATRLPPAIPTQHETAHGQEDSRIPMTAEAAIGRADRFARSQLPSHYRLRSLFQATPNHPIVLKLTDDNGHTAESTITTFEPDATRALDIKRQVQAHLLDIPGIAPYRGPLKEASHNIALDEMLPSAPGRQRITPKYGEYRLRITWDQPKEEISISLGLIYSADNQAEAERRAAFVQQEVTRLRDANPTSQYLPITKRDLCDSLRNHVRAHGGPWEELTHGQIDGFPASLRFPFAGRGHEQDSWLQIDALKTDGNPNLTWVLPIHIIVNGQKLANASTHVNLHVRDRQAAEARAIETVNRMMTIVSELPNHAQFAVDPELPQRLQGLSEAARAAAPHLIDTNRLKDIQNELRSPHQQDLTVQVIGEPRLVNGKQEFALGIFRGSEKGVLEPVLEQPDVNQPPTAVRRSFAIDADKIDSVHNFEQNVRQTFQAIINEEYDPRSSRNFDREHMRKLKAPRPFHPDYAPLVLDDAIGSNLASSPAVTPVEPASYQARGRTHRAGQGYQAGVAGRH